MKLLCWADSKQNSPTKIQCSPTIPNKTKIHRTVSENELGKFQSRGSRTMIEGTLVFHEMNRSVLPLTSVNVGPFPTRKKNQ
jgi:hypothetical protein